MKYTEHQLALKAHIEQQNEQSKNEVEAMGGTLFSETVSDPEHWAEYGIENTEQYQHYEAQSNHYELYKEVHGVRPPFMKYDTMSSDEIWYHVDLLIGQNEDQIKAEKARKAADEVKAEARKEANKYQPNLALKGLGDLMI